MKKKELVLTGSVRAWQRENVLRAGKLTLSDLDRRVLAEGSVKATFRRQGGTSAVTKSLLNSGEIINATADRLLHTEASQVVRLEGSSSVVSGQWKLDADVSEFHLGPDSTIQYAESKGGVVMEDRQTSRRGEGSKAIWMPQNEVVTLEGNPAKAVDGQGNRVEGALLLFRPGKTRVDVETASGIRTEGVFRPEGP
jgi:lipopolysaccharide export system protein LptA